MIIYLTNNSESPSAQLEAKYLDGTGIINPSSDGYLNLYGSRSLNLKLKIAAIPSSSFKVAKATLNIPIKEPLLDVRLSLYESTVNAYQSSVGTSEKENLIDMVSLVGKDTASGQKETFISFDITNYLRLKLSGQEEGTLYLKALSTYGQLDMKKIDSALLSKETLVEIQLFEPSGLDNLGEYEKVASGASGTSCINLASGKLVHHLDVINTNGPKPVSLAFFRHDGKWEMNTKGEMRIVDNQSCDFSDSTGKVTRYYVCDRRSIENVYGSKHLKGFSGYCFMSLSDSSYLLLENPGTEARIVNGNGNVYVFKISSNGIFRLYKIIGDDGNEVTYELGDIHVATRIVSSSNEKIEVTFNGRNPIEAKAYDLNGTLLGKATIVWEGSDVKSIKRYLGTGTTEISSISFSYQNGNIAEAKDLISNFGSSFEYDSNNRVAKASSGPLTEEKPYSTFAYEEGKTRITGFDGHYVDYFFDGFSRLLLKIDDEGRSVTKNYSESVNGETGNLKRESGIIPNKRILVKNGSFESSLAAWTLEEGDSAAISFPESGVHGQKCLSILKGNNPIRLSQEIKNCPLGFLSFSSFIKADGNPNPGDIKVKLTVSYLKRGVTGKYQLVEKVFALQNEKSGPFDWVRKDAGTISIQDLTAFPLLNVKAKVEIILSGSGYVAKFDNIQFVKGTETIARDNLVMDGWFEDWVSYPWTLMGTTTGDGVVTIPEAERPAFLNSRSLSLSKDATVEKKATLEIPLEGKEGEEFVISLLGKGETTVNDAFGIKVKFLHLDGTSSLEERFLFDPHCSFWQVLSRRIKTEKAYSKVTLTLFSKSSHDVVFDGVQLRKGSSGAEYRYNDKRNLTKMVSHSKTPLSLSYDRDSKLQETIIENGESYRYYYNEDKTIRKIVDGNGKSVEFTYQNGKVTLVESKSPDGFILKTKRVYDAIGNVISERNESNNVTYYEYDVLSRLKKMTRPSGLATSYTYNEKGEIQQETHAFDNVTNYCRYTYQQDGTLKKIITGGATDYEFVYDNGKRLTEVKIDGATTLKREYGKLSNGINLGLVTKETLGTSGDYKEYEYDLKGRLTAISVNGIKETSFLYDEMDNVIVMADLANGREEYFDYDAESHLIKKMTIRNDNEPVDEIRYEYDDVDNVQKEETKAFGIEKAVEYDYGYETNGSTPTGFLEKLASSGHDEIIRGGSGFVPQHGERPYLNTAVEGEPTSDIVPHLSYEGDNMTTVYKISRLNSLREDWPEGSSSNSFKDGLCTNRIISLWIKPTGPFGSQQKIVSFASHACSDDCLKLVIEPNGKVAAYDLFEDTEPVLISYKTLTPNEWNFVYLSFAIWDRRMDVTLSVNGISSGYYYQRNKNLDELWYMKVGDVSPSLSVENLYKLDEGENAANPIRPKVPFRLAYLSIGISETADATLKEIYDEGTLILNSNLPLKSSIMRRTINGDDAFLLSSKTTYDGLGRMTGTIISKGTKSLSSSIAYKENGNLSTSLPETFRDFLARTATYSYDSMGRITSETWTAEPAMTNVPFPEDRTHSYDGLGRLSSSTIGEETHSYSYDSNGNILSKDGVTYSYDPIVRDRLLSRSDGTLMEYDSSNPGYPTRILKPGKDLSLSWKCGLLMSIGEASYSYGPSGIRVSKAVGNVSETYSLDGERILALRRIGGTHEGTLLFDHDENGRLIGFSLDGKDYVYLRNLQGDVLGILGMDGKCYVSYSYDDWGVPASKVLDLSVGPRLLELNPFLYRGCFYDRETGLYYLNSRYYDPDLGRFMSPDRISYLDPSFPGGASLYAYCGNDPVNMVDPSGKSTTAALVISLLLLFTPVGGTAFQIAVSVLSYVGMAIASLFDESIRSDMEAIGWNPFNTNETTTLESNKVSFYKGVPVFRTTSSWRSGSFGAIFLAEGSDVNDLRHESGHNWQLMLMGIATYGFAVGIPSPLKLGNQTGKNGYYDTPWETMADILGGVSSRKHSRKQIIRAITYHVMTFFALPLAPFYW